MKTFLKLFAVSAAAALSACSTVNTVERSHATANPAPVADKRIITDSSLNDSARVVGVISARAGGLLKVQMQIMNTTSSPQQINYKFSWVDAGGMEIPSPMSVWQTLVLEGKESKFISAVAPSPNANDFTLKLFPNVRD